MKTMMITAVLLFTTMLNITAQTNESNLVYYSEMKDGRVATVYAYEKDHDTLSIKLKNVYDYDQQGRMTKREVQKWNRRKQQWVNLRCWTHHYSDDKVTVEYARWNKRNKKYSPVTQKMEYDLVGDKVVAVNIFKLDKKRNEYQLIDNCPMIVSIDESKFQAKVEK